MVHHNVCPLCTSAEIIFHLRCIDHFISKEEFDLYKCKTCNFVFTQDFPEEDAIAEYYESEDYISHSDTDKGFSNKIYRLARDFMLKRKRKLIKDTTGIKNGSLLDIGSGTGHFAHIMMEEGWNVKGVEINEKARNFSTSRFGLELLDTDQLSLLDAESFDCITLWHVLEHFHNPLKYASEISRLLKPDGFCLIALPNSSSYDAEYYIQYWAAYDVPRHLWHFSPETFQKLSEKTGFVIDNIKHLPLDLFYISILSERYRGAKMSFLVGIIKALPFALKSMYNKSRSSSVIYLLRKRTDQ